MPRIRTVKPELFRHEGLQDLELANPGCHCMLVFVGLWGHCDAQGVFEFRPRQLKLDILPYLPFDMATALQHLVEAGFILVYASGGKEYGYIPGFLKHQRLSGKEAGPDGVKHPAFTGTESGATEVRLASACEATGQPSYTTVASTENDLANDRAATLKRPGSSGENLDSQEEEKEEEEEGEGSRNGTRTRLSTRARDGAMPSTAIVAIEPSWYDGEDSTAATIARAVESTTVKGGKCPYAGLCDEAGCRKLADRWLALGGDQDALEGLFSSWQDHHAGKAKAPYSKPLQALNDWVTRREADMRRLKRERERDAGKRNGKPTALEIAEAAARGMGATF
ncbi:MAG: hypothetical protein JSS66_09215 [Armatimonadetes bacterium]|nr:hypothetical protein [Armatimonadota bacterium]